MPNRILKENICTSETLDQLTSDEERAFYRLLTACDDYGRFDGRASVIVGRCFPLKAARGEVTERTMEEWLQRLSAADLIQLYYVEGKRYLQVTKWFEHQQVRAKTSKFPQPITLAPKPQQEKPSDITCNQTQSDESNGQHMPPYSYSESNSDTYSESNSVKEEEEEKAKLFEERKQALRLFLRTDCDPALSDPNLDYKWGNYLVYGFDVDTIKRAVQEAALHGSAKVPLYVFRILDSWHRNGAHTVDKAEALLAAHAGNKNRAKQQQPTKPTTVAAGRVEGIDPEEVYGRT